MEDMPRVLVISNTALKRSNSNGLSILSILSAIPQSSIASFYIQDTYPDKGVASTHFRLTDSEKIHSFFIGGRNGTIVTDESIPDVKESIDAQDASIKGKESFFNHDARNFIWKRGYWNKKKLYAWVGDFRPTVILFMNGRSPFMFDITRDIARRFSIPVVYYASEDEYWHPSTNFWDNILRKNLKKATLGLNQCVKHVIAFHDKLGKMYEDEFHLPVTVIMPSTSLEPVDKVNGGGNWLYAGNLKPYRYESLKDISIVLAEADPKRIIDVYSNDIDDEIKDYLSSCTNVALHEALPRNVLNNVRRNASVLLHFESFSPKARPLIQNAFSSKIADCLALGIPFLVYAPDYCGFSPYLVQEKDAVSFARAKSELPACVQTLIVDSKARQNMSRAATALANVYHDLCRNSERVKSLLKQISSPNQSKDVIRVLNVGMSTNYGGTESIIYEIYHHLDRNQIQFDFLNVYDKPLAKQEWLESLGARVFPLKLKRREGYLKYLKGIKSFYKKHAHDFDAVVCHVQCLDQIVMAKYAKKYGIKRVMIHLHNANYGIRPSKLAHLAIAWNKRHCHRYVDAFLACSSLAAQWGFNHKDAQRALIVKNGIPIEAMKFDEEKRNHFRSLHSYENKNRVYGSAGRLDPQKNQTFLLEVYEKIFEMDPDARFVLLGRGPLEAGLRTIIEERGLSDVCLLISSIEDIGEFYSGIDCFVFPSKFEGLGMVLIEAQCSGLPCLATEGTIPKEAKISESVLFMPLDLGASAWAKTAMTMPDRYRDEAYQDVIDDGRDILETAKEYSKLFS